MGFCLPLLASSYLPGWLFPDFWGWVHTGEGTVPFGLSVIYEELSGEQPVFSLP